METSREAQAQTGLTFYFLGKTHAGLRKLSAYYRQRGFRVSNLADASELAEYIAQAPPDIILIDLQSRNDIAEFVQTLGEVDPGNDTPRVAIISSTTDEDTAEALKEQCDESVSWPLKATDLSVKLYHLITRKGDVVGALPDGSDDSASLYRGSITPGILKALLQTLYLSRRDAVLTMESEGRRGNLWFKDGKLIDAQVGALDWEESLDLIRRFALGSLTITFQDVERRRFIESNALQWLAQREAEEATVLSQNDDDFDVAAGLLDAVGGDDGDSDVPEILGAPSVEDEEAFEVTNSTPAFNQEDFGLDDYDDDDEGGSPGDDDLQILLGQSPRDHRTLPALRALREEEEAMASAYSDYDDDDYDDDDYDDDYDYDDDDDYDYDDDDDYDDYDDTEGTVARVSIQVGRFSREELEERRRMEAVGLEEQPFRGTRIAPITMMAAEAVSAPGGVEDLGMIAAGEADASDFDEVDYQEEEILPADIGSGAIPGVAALAAGAAIGIGTADFDDDLGGDFDTTGAPSEDAPTLEPRAVPVYGAPEPTEAPPLSVPPPIAPAMEEPIIAVGATEDDEPVAAAPVAAASIPKAPVAQAAYPPKAPAERPVVAQRPYAPIEGDRRKGLWVVPVIILLLLGFIVWGLSGDSEPKGPGPIAGVPNSGNANEENPNRGLIGTDPKNGAGANGSGQGSKPAIIPPVERPAKPENTEPKDNGSTSAQGPKPPVVVAATPKPEQPSTPKPTPKPEPKATPAPANPQDTGAQVIASKPPSTPKPEPVAPTPTKEPTVDTGTDTAASAEALASLLDKASRAERSGNLDSAMVLFAQAVDMDPNSQTATSGLNRVKKAKAAPALESGELIVNSYPYGLLYIDGEKVGYTPWNRMDAIPRKYVIRVTNPDFGACSVVKEVRPGERTFVHLKLEDDQACGRTSTP